MNKKLPMNFFAILYAVFIIASTVIAIVHFNNLYLSTLFVIWSILAVVFLSITYMDSIYMIQICRIIHFVTATTSSILFCTALVLLINVMSVDRGYYKRQDDYEYICYVRLVFSSISMVLHSLVYWSITFYIDSVYDYKQFLVLD